MKPISEKAVQEYKEIYRKEYGRDISDDEAREQGERLVRLVFELNKIPCKGPATKDNYEELRFALEWKRRTIGPRDPFVFMRDVIKRFEKPEEMMTPRFLRSDFPYLDDPSYRYKVRVS